MALAVRFVGAFAACLAAGGAAGDVGVNKSFAPNSVSAGQASTLTVVFLNPNPAAATGTAITDALPANVVVASPPNAVTTCGGTVTATPGAGSVALSGATVPAAAGATAGQCQFTVGVLSNTPGTYINTLPVNAVTSSQGGNTQAAQATLVATALVAITGTKAFSPANVHAGGSASTMTITLTNANGVALTNTAFTDTFPASVILANPPNLATTCAGGTVTGVAGGASLQLSGATIPATGSCTVTASVVTGDPNAAVNAARTNSIAAKNVTTAQGVTNSAIAGNLTVQSGAALAKAFAPTTIVSGKASTLTITVSNFNATALAGVSFTDTFPATMVVATPANASTTCGGTLTATPGAGSVDLSGGSLTAAPAGATARTCTVVVSVTATNAGASAQTLTNTLAAGTFGTVNYTGGSANLVVNPASPITGTKTYSPAAVQSGTTVATVTLTNTTGSAATITSFTDNLTTLGAGFTVASSPAPGGTCGATITAPVGGTSVTATGGTVPAGGSCTITFPLAIAITVAQGAHVNTIAAGAVQTTQGGNTLAITGPVDLARAFTAAKAYAPATVQMGATSTLTVTFTHNANAVPLSNLSFTDALPAGHTIASPPNASTTCGGALTATAGAGSFSLAGGALGAGATSCTVQVAVAAPGSVGSAINTVAAGAVTTTEGATNAAFTATLTRVSTSVTVNKSFTPATVAVGGTSQVAIQVRNNNANAIQLTNVGLVDALPAGMQVASPAGLAFTGSGCSLGSISLSGGLFTLGGATINANSICTLSANVQATAAGNLINNLPIGVVTSAQGVTNPAAVAATLASSGTAFLSITKSDGVTTVVPGGTSTYTVIVTNTGPNDVAGLGVDDAPAAGVTFTAWSCTASTGSQCTASGTGAIADTVTLLNGGTLTYTVDASFAAGLSGTTTNTASLSVPGSVVNTNSVSSASDTDTLTPVTSLAVSKSDGSVTYTPGTTGVYGIVVTNGGPSDALGVTWADALPAGVTLSGAATCVAAGGASCGTLSGGTGATSVNASGAVVPAGGGAQLTLTLPVAFAAGMTAPSITNTVSVADGPSGGSASASDSDTRAAQVALSATKSDGATTYTPGGTATYVATIGNAGPSTAVNVTVSDPLPAGVTLNAPASCVATAGSSCGALFGAAGATSVTASGASIVPGGTLTLTLPARFGSAMTAASITNTVSALEAGGASISASDTDARQPQVALTIMKSDGAIRYTPGGTSTYAIVVANTGLSDAHAVTVGDVLPAGLALTSAPTCVAVGVATCGAVSGAAGGTSVGASGATVAAGAGNSITLSVPVAFAPGMTTDPLLNTATAGDPDDPIVHSAVDSDARQSEPSLVLTKSDGSATYTPGSGATYTLTLKNAGPSDALDVSVSDALPAGVVLSGPVSCVASGAASCGTVSGAAGQAAAEVVNAVVPAGPANGLTVTLPVAFDAGMTADPLVNTASATDVASGVGTTASDSDALALQVALAVTKSDGSATYTPGGTAVYAILVTNAGPSEATSVTVADTLPAGVVLTAGVGCVATGDASCGTVVGAAGQTGFAATGASVGSGPGSALAFTVPVAFAAGLATDPLVNTATATDARSGNVASARDSDARSVAVSLAVAKTDGSATYRPGGSAMYLVTVTNGGISDALDVAVIDTLPAGVTLAGTATCATTGNASCGAVSGAAGGSGVSVTGARVDAGPGNAVMLSIPVTFAAGLAADPLVNIATAVDASSGASGSGSDSDARLAQVTLTVAKTDGSAAYTPGGGATYTVTIGNTGTSDALDVTIGDLLPAGVTLSAAPACAIVGSASCGTVMGAAGQAAFGATGAQLHAGGTDALVFTVPVMFASSLVDDPLINTATATDRASGASGSAADSDVRTPRVALSVTKSDGSATYTPGGNAVYTIVVGNAGPSDAADVALVDTLPAGSLLAAPATCIPTGNATCGALTGGTGQSSASAQGAFIAAGGGNALTFTLPVAFAAGSTADPLINGVVVTDAASGATASAVDSDALSAAVTLAVTKTDGSATYTPGSGGTYAIVVTNLGVSDATSVSVDDPLPAGVTLAGPATCVASGASACGVLIVGAGGTSVATIGSRIAPGADNALVVTVPVTFASTLATDPLVNTARAVDSISGASGTAADSDARFVQSTLSITKTDNQATYSPGGQGTYVVTVANAGPSEARDVAVSDNLPGGVVLRASATCKSNGAATCGALSGAVGATSVSLTGGTIGAGPGNSLVLTIPVAFAAGLAADPLVNTASASAGASAAVLATDSNTRAQSTVLAITNTDNRSRYIPGDNGTYVVTLANIGLSNATNVGLTDALPAGVVVQGIPTCAAGGNASCGSVSGVTGAGVVTLSGATIGVGAANRLSLSIPVRIDAALRADPLVNTATATADAAASVTAIDSDALDVRAALTLAKTDNSASYDPGGTATYVLRLGNTGPSDATGLGVVDNLPAGMTLAGAPTCAPTGIASCGTMSGTASGTAFTVTGAALAAGPGNTLTYQLTVRLAASLAADPLVNVASATADGGASASASDSDTRVAPTVRAPTPAPIPASERAALALLALLILALGWRRPPRRS